MNYDIYANQFIPLCVDCDIIDRVKLDGAFSKVLTGGGISHLNLSERLTHKDQMKKLIEYAIKYGCEHFAINYNYCQCENKHTTISGQAKNCPICSAPIVEQYTRIIGYFVPVSTWNRGRQKEHGLRVFKENPLKEKAKKQVCTEKQGVQEKKPVVAKEAKKTVKAATQEVKEVKQETKQSTEKPVIKKESKKIEKKIEQVIKQESKKQETKEVKAETKETIKQDVKKKEKEAVKQEVKVAKKEIVKKEEKKKPTRKKKQQQQLLF